MDTLYDLLGALPRDDAEGLRTAFRRAAKGAHPDIRPGDPDAALKFRQIVRAHEILGDAEQRAAYDHLMALAQQERDPASAHPIAARVHRLASGVMTFSVTTIVAAGGYLLFMHMSTALVATADKVDATPRLSREIAASAPADSPRPTDENWSIAKAEITASIDPKATSTASAPTNVGFFAVPGLGALPDSAPNYARFFHARGISAYRNGDFNGAIADLDQAIQLDPKLSVSYIDRGIVFYRLRKFDRAFADIARAKRIEKQGQAKSAQAAAVKPHSDHAAAAPAATPLPQRRPVVLDSHRHEWSSQPHDWVASAAFN